MKPTNHLDLNSIAWLEGFLSNYKGAVIIISHDRYFLDKIVTKVVEIENTKCTTYNGNYSDYATKKASLREAELKNILISSRKSSIRKRLSRSSNLLIVRNQLKELKVVKNS